MKNNKVDPKKPASIEINGEGRISARILDAESGLRELTNVYAVRIHSRKFYALIMNDYLPTLGKVEGNVTFLSKEGELAYRGIRGFYKHQHNEFTLLIEDHIKIDEDEMKEEE